MAKKENEGAGTDVLAGLRNSGTARERSMFWKPERVAEAMVGKLSHISEHNGKLEGEKFRVAHFTDAAVMQPGAGFVYVRDAQVVMTNSISSRITPNADKGRCFLIEFGGTEPSDKGSDSKIFVVTEIPALSLKEALSTASH